jgi:glycosyltransferase involved in cell wall biosynthesis
MNIAFITSGHDPFDDRIFYHMARTMRRASNNVLIVSSMQDLTEVNDGIKIECFSGNNLTKKNKINRFIETLSVFKPNLIVCSEPLTVLAAYNYSKRVSAKVRIVYDITEWYPSKKNLSPYPPVLRWLFCLSLLLVNILAGVLADCFIFGEFYKSRPFRLLFPLKKYLFISYYPDLRYIPYCNHELKKGNLRLSYSGKISMEKGYGNFFRVLNKISCLKKDLFLNVKIIGWYETMKDKAECEHLFAGLRSDINLQVFERQSFPAFIELIEETDIFLDLRSDDFENQHCLPIKLFYYAALGRPVIQSNLKAIRKEVEIEKFGYLVRPGDSDLIVRHIFEYLENEKLYYQHCIEARKLAQGRYNWQKAETAFIKFLSS